MSAASIDRYLKPTTATDQLRGKTTTKPSPLRSSIKVRKAGDEVEAEPGFFEGDTIAHCGPTLKGEFARPVNLTCVHTGWVFTRTVRNNAHIHILGALKAGVEEVPIAVTGLDFDTGTGFLNKAVITWASEREIFFTRSCPAAVAVGPEPSGFLGRGQVVEPVVDQPPQPVQHDTFLGGVVAVVKAVLAHQVVVLRLDGGLVVLLVRPRAPARCPASVRIAVGPARGAEVVRLIGGSSERTRSRAPISTSCGSTCR